MEASTSEAHGLQGASDESIPPPPGPPPLWQGSVPVGNTYFFDLAAGVRDPYRHYYDSARSYGEDYRINLQIEYEKVRSFNTLQRANLEEWQDDARRMRRELVQAITQRNAMEIKIKEGKFDRIPERYSENLWRVICWMLD